MLALEETSIKCTPRYPLRSRSLTRSSSSSSLTSEFSSESLPRKRLLPPKVIKDYAEKGKKALVAYDPFDALLKEKKLAEKNGKGHDAFHRAETTAGKSGENALLDEMDEEDMAALAVRDRDWLINRPLTPDSNGGNNDDLRLGDAESRKLFGEDGGKAIMGILEHDKIAKKEVLNRQVSGLRFWLSGMAHRTTILMNEAPIAEISSTSPLIGLLKKSIQRGGMFITLLFSSLFHNLFQTFLEQL